VSLFRPAGCSKQELVVAASLIIAMQANSDIASAKTFRMICENPRREYLVEYSTGDREIEIRTDGSKTLFAVLAVQDKKDEMIIAAQAPNSGPALRIHFRPYKKIQYFVDAQLFQTDGCR
jgi:hypothetical protein